MSQRPKLTIFYMTLPLIIVNFTLRIRQYAPILSYCPIFTCGKGVGEGGGQGARATHFQKWGGGHKWAHFWAEQMFLEYVARVKNHSCDYVDKLSNREIVNICSVTGDVLHLSR